MPNSKINVMIVDDSPTARRILTDIINRHPEMEVVSAVSDPYEAVPELKRRLPDVMVLDVQMPRMDGVTFLKKLMTIQPLPVVMCSSFTEKGSSLSLQCLENGAVDIIAKPRIATKCDMQELETRIHDTIKSAAIARFRSRSGKGLAPAKTMARPMQSVAKLTADEVLPPPTASSISKIPDTPKIIALGASTGGTNAIREFLETLPEDCPGIVMVQHMPERFTESFANRLNEICAIEVREAKTGDDGATGMLEMKEAGAYNFAQDKDSCVVFGMPNEAILKGGVDETLPLSKLSLSVLNRTK